MDTADGVFMSHAYGWAFSNPIRKVYYNITVTTLSVVVALAIGTIELLQVLSAKLSLTGGPWDWLNGLDFGRIGYGIVGRLRADVGGLGRRVEEGAHRGALGRHGRERLSRARTGVEDPPSGPRLLYTRFKCHTGGAVPNGQPRSLNPEDNRTRRRLRHAAGSGTAAPSPRVLAEGRDGDWARPAGLTSI